MGGWARAPGALAAAFMIGSCFCHAGNSGAEVFYGSAVWGGARTLALGETCGAVMTDTESLFQTPAGIAYAVEPQFVLGHTVWGEAAPAETLAAALPMGDLGTLGFAGFYQSLGDIEERDYSGSLVGTFSLDTYAGTIIYARPIGYKLSVGVSGGILSQQGGELNGQDMPLGAGLIWIDKGWTVGASGMDLSSEEPVYQLSAAHAIDAAGIGVILAGGGILRENDRRIGIGAELKLNSIVALRGGYQMALGDSGVEGLRNLSAGMGLQYPTMGLDYGFLPLGDIGQVHRFQVRFKFAGGSDASARVPQKVQSRTAEPVPAPFAENPPPPPPPTTYPSPAREIVPAVPSEPASAPAAMSTSADSGPKEEVEVEFIVPASAEEK